MKQKEEKIVLACKIEKYKSKIENTKELREL